MALNRAKNIIEQQSSPAQKQVAIEALENLLKFHKLVAPLFKNKESRDRFIRVMEDPDRLRDVAALLPNIKVDENNSQYKEAHDAWLAYVEKLANLNRKDGLKELQVIILAESSYSFFAPDAVKAVKNEIASAKAKLNEPVAIRPQQPQRPDVKSPGSGVAPSSQQPEAKARVSAQPQAVVPLSNPQLLINMSQKFNLLSKEAQVKPGQDSQNPSINIECGGNKITYSILERMLQKQGIKYQGNGSTLTISQKENTKQALESFIFDRKDYEKQIKHEINMIRFKTAIEGKKIFRVENHPGSQTTPGKQFRIRCDDQSALVNLQGFLQAQGVQALVGEKSGSPPDRFLIVTQENLRNLGQEGINQFISKIHGFNILASELKAEVPPPHP